MRGTTAWCASYRQPLHGRATEALEDQVEAVRVHGRSVAGRLLWLRDSLRGLCASASKHRSVTGFPSLPNIGRCYLKPLTAISVGVGSEFSSVQQVDRLAESSDKRESEVCRWALVTRFVNCVTGSRSLPSDRWLVESRLHHDDGRQVSNAYLVSSRRVGTPTLLASLAKVAERPCDAGAVADLKR